MSGPDDPSAWLAKADSDLLCIANNVAAERVPWDAVCYHAQQAAEKSLKAVLALRSATIPRTHDLLALLAGCAAAKCPLDHLRNDADLLNPFSAAARYPGLAPDPDGTLANDAVAAARRIHTAVLRLVRPA